MSVELWKPDAVVAYCSGEDDVLIDSGPHRVNATLPQSRTWSIVAGHRNRHSVLCDDTTSGTAIPFDPSLYAEGFTVTCWVKPSSIKDAPICGVRTAANGGFMIRITSLGVLNVVRYGSGSGQISTPGVFSAGVWTHFAAYMEPTSMALFINGVRRGPTSAPGTPIVGVTSIGVLGTQSFYQGAGGVVGGGYYGELADLCIWPKIIGTEEISWLANPRNNILSIPRAGFPLSRLAN